MVKFEGWQVRVPPFGGAGVQPLAHIVRRVIVTLARLSTLIGWYGMMPDIDVWTEASFPHELVEFAPPPIRRRRISARRRASD
jgi:hypothetical protein